MHKLLFISAVLVFVINAHSQNVGIGTNTPKAALEVNGSLNTPAVPGPGTSSGVFRLAGSSNGGLDFGIHTVPWMQAGFGGVPADISLQALGGKVGIGTTSPQYQLHVKSPNDAVHAIDAGTTGAAWNYYLQNGTLRSAIGWSNVNSALSFYVNGADRMVINNNGHVGIGNTSPSYPLHFANGNGDKIVLGYNGDPNKVTGLGTIGNNLVISGGDYFDQSNTIRLGYGSSGAGIASVLTVAPYPGKVGINNTLPTATLDVNGTVKITDGTQGEGKVLMSDVNGNAYWKGVVACSAGNSGSLVASDTLQPNSAQTIVFKNELYDDGGNNYDPDTGIFTAPVSGIYHCSANVLLFRISGNSSTGIFLDISVNDQLGPASRFTCTDILGLIYSMDIKLNAGDNIRFKVYNGSDKFIIMNTNNDTRMSIHLVR